MADDRKPNKNAEISQGTIWVLGLGAIIIPAILIYFGVVTPNAHALIWVAIALIVFSILITLPNLIPYFKGKRREKLIKQGKIKVEQKKSYNPNHRFDDDE